MKFTESTLEKSTAIMGINGPSVLFLLPGFTRIHGCVPHHVHCVCLVVLFESYNRELLEMVKSTLGVALQILRFCFRRHFQSVVNL